MALKTCPKGHTFNKTSDCPTCPVCESLNKPKDGFLSTLAAPARRALENNGITTLNQLSSYTEKEVLSFHGMGKGSLPKLRAALAEQGLRFK
jgi:DNA-directed RNA polymerase alpha subunit